MKKSEVQRLSNEVFVKVVERYGDSRYQPSTPYLVLESSPYADAKDPNAKGVFDFDDNEIVVYWKNMDTVEELVRTVVHEYQHYLQSPRWFARYYTMGHTYESHPYEVKAYAEEENWKSILN